MKICCDCAGSLKREMQTLQIKFPLAWQSDILAAQDQQAGSASLQTDEGWQEQPDVLHHPIRGQQEPALAIGKNVN